jgi:purine-binding chemotaxis protein CheW
MSDRRAAPLTWQDALHAARLDLEAVARSRRPAAPVVWQDVHAQLARAGTALAEALHPSPQRARAVLEERARKLAQTQQEASTAEGLLVVAFHLANERFAVEARYVREVLRLSGGCTPLPGAPPFVHGILNLRGEILDVLDLRPLLGLAAPISPVPAREQTAARVIVLGVDRAELGLLVDAADEVTKLLESDVHATPESITGPGREYLRGVTAQAVSLVDGAVLLRDDRLFVDQPEEANA